MSLVHNEKYDRSRQAVADEEADELEQLRKHFLAEGSKQTYGSAVRAYGDFCDSRGRHAFPVTIDVVEAFAAFLIPLFLTERPSEI